MKRRSFLMGLVATPFAAAAAGGEPSPVDVRPVEPRKLPRPGLVALPRSIAIDRPGVYSVALAAVGALVPDGATHVRYDLTMQDGDYAPQTLVSHVAVPGLAELRLHATSIVVRGGTKISWGGLPPGVQGRFRLMRIASPDDDDRFFMQEIRC